ncbi:hypothetical protein RDABS01_015124 [Bienertia sinuspersici]
MGPILTEDQATNLARGFTNEDIIRAVFSIPSNKAPSSYGFNSTFFKESWRIMGEDVCKVGQSFFETGQLLKEVNYAKLTLIPKVQHP